MTTKLSGNKGEWSEIYIFLKLMNDGKVYAADKDMNKIKNVFLNIIKIIREEISNQRYEYLTGKTIKIFLNEDEVGPSVDVSEFEKYKDELWNLIQTTPQGNGISSESIETFLNSIHVNKLKAPASKQNDYFGGTQDITMEVMDFRSGINSTIGFSCKSDFTGKATLFNASKDNTNFLYEITGPITRSLMNEFNNTFKYKNKKNKETGEIEQRPEVAIGDRIALLKRANCNIEYRKMCIENAQRNLILSGGNELPIIVGNMLKAYYWIGEGKAYASSLLFALDYVTKENVAEYPFTELESLYRRKIGTLLFDMFTGMRLSTPWDGRSSVNGGYIVAKNDGDVVAYHSCIADEFKDFLVEQLGFESPSAIRHQYMTIEEIDNKFYLKLNLQVRFKGNASEMTNEENIQRGKRLSTYASKLSEQ